MGDQSITWKFNKCLLMGRAPMDTVLVVTIAGGQSSQWAPLRDFHLTLKQGSNMKSDPV